MIKIGLTGSIGMGKSTTAAMFAERDVPVWDADAAVHRLYGPDGLATGRIGAVFPSAVTEAGVDRTVLKSLISGDPTVLRRIEAIVHPLVAQDRMDFVTQAQKTGAPAVLLDIPLLFETGGDAQVDVIVVVSAPEATQRARVLERSGMTAAHFEAILAKQLPDAQKRARADFVIETTTLDRASEGVDTVLAHVERMRDA